MASPFPRVYMKLGYPVYAVNFDPQDTTRLVVGGGGGGDSQFGVRNKITVLETVGQDELRVAGEHELPRDEDSVMSLALGGPAGKPSYLFAGVNSSAKSVAKGVNEHLRTFSVQRSRTRAFPGDGAPEVKVAELSRCALFENPDADAYQRLLRVAGAVGAAGSSLGGEPQIAVFDASGPRPEVKGVMELPGDAEDLDIVQEREGGGHLLAFCYKYELHLVRIGEENGDPELVFTMPDDHGERPAFHSIRFLTPDFILAASNLPKRSGVLIQGFRLPTPGHARARIAATVRIPRKISATALAVANISPPPSPAAPVGNTQFAIAVAGSDSSVSLYTLEHKTESSLKVLADLYPFAVLENVYGRNGIGKLAFSSFAPESHKASSQSQFIKLASICLESVAVHSIPLKKHVDRSSAKDPKAEAQPARYVIAMRSRPPSNRPLVITLAVVVLILAIIARVMERYLYSLRG